MKNDDKNYRANKNSISKFLQDEAQHYQTEFEKLSKQVNFDEKGMNGPKVCEFMKKLFETPYTAVIQKGKHFFEDETEV